MPAPIPLRSTPPEPPALHLRAMDNLRFIRETMEQASSFTAVSGWGLLFMGGVALVAAAVAWPRATDVWLLTWVVAAVVALAGSSFAIQRKARATRMPLLVGQGRKCVLGFAPPVLAGALLSGVLYRAGVTEAIPGMWLLLYGAGVVAGGAYSVKSVPVMGFCFMLAGGAALLSPAGWANGFMVAGFGGLHLAFGALIVRRHGG